VRGRQSGPWARAAPTLYSKPSVSSKREWRNLADAPDLGSGARKGVGVQIPPLAPTLTCLFREAAIPVVLTSVQNGSKVQARSPDEVVSNLRGGVDGSAGIPSGTH
jgi:hypothetical protein